MQNFLSQSIVPFSMYFPVSEVIWAQSRHILSQVFYHHWKNVWAWRLEWWASSASSKPPSQKDANRIASHVGVERDFTRTWLWLIFGKWKPALHNAMMTLRAIDEYCTPDGLVALFHKAPGIHRPWLRAPVFSAKHSYKWKKRCQALMLTILFSSFEKTA